MTITLTAVTKGGDFIDWNLGKVDGIFTADPYISIFPGEKVRVESDLVIYADGRQFEVREDLFGRTLIVRNNF